MRQALRRQGAMGLRNGASVMAGFGLLIAPVQVAAQVTVSGSVLVSQVEHRVSAGRGVEQTSGTIFGGAGTMRLASRFEITVQGQSGTLNADSAFADDREEAEGEVRVAVLAVPWLALEGGLSARSFATTLARQRWTALHLGAEARLAFVGGAFEGRIRGELLPSVSVTGLQAPNRAVAAAAGFEWRSGALTAGLQYALERYDFPLVETVKRHEQLSLLTVSLGLRLGSRD
ncbi:MAG: hypothetical protein HYR48_05630 [Gemmatimonadetes bacterium]|nr:hypothetical protein [Gemmatimonadota bacterium]